MFKVVWIARFPRGMAKEEARRHWAEIHGPMCAKSSIGRYVQNHVVGPLPLATGVAAEETFFDGYSCGWWADEEAFRATMASPEWQALAEDGHNVFDMSWLEGMSAQVVEHPMIEGPASPYKVVWIVRFKTGMEPEQAREYWRTVHGAIFKSLEIDRYVQNHATAPVGGGGAGRDPLRFDGFSECWFKDEAQFRRAVESPTWADAVIDGENLFDMSQMWGAVLHERVVKSGERELATA